MCSDRPRPNALEARRLALGKRKFAKVTYVAPVPFVDFPRHAPLGAKGVHPGKEPRLDGFDPREKRRMVDAQAREGVRGCVASHRPSSSRMSPAGW